MLKIGWRTPRTVQGLYFRALNESDLVSEPEQLQSGDGEVFVYCEYCGRQFLDLTVYPIAVFTFELFT